MARLATVASQAIIYSSKQAYVIGLDPESLNNLTFKSFIFSLERPASLTVFVILRIQFSYITLKVVRIMFLCSVFKVHRSELSI
jgi:hypothetical protein